MTAKGRSEGLDFGRYRMGIIVLSITIGLPIHRQRENNSLFMSSPAFAYHIDIDSVLDLGGGTGMIRIE